jgi:alpha-N-arabinofuranosidase
MTNDKGLYLQTTYFPLVEYGKQRGNVAIDPFVSAPTYRLAAQGGRGGPAGPEIPYLDVSASYNPKTRQVFLNVLNRSKDKAIETTIQNQEGTLGAEMAVWEMNHPDLKATHTFGDDQKVRPVRRTAAVTLQPGGFTYTFPAHSLTILQLTLQPHDGPTGRTAVFGGMQ